MMLFLDVLNKDNYVLQEDKRQNIVASNTKNKKHKWYY